MTLSMPPSFDGGQMCQPGGEFPIYKLMECDKIPVCWVNILGLIAQGAILRLPNAVAGTRDFGGLAFENASSEER
jgi:hypothetical protein